MRPIKKGFENMFVGEFARNLRKMNIDNAASVTQTVIFPFLRSGLR